MALESLLQKLQDVADRIRVVEREKNEAMESIQSLEREASELRNLIAQAESKADEMLNGAPASPTARGLAAPKAQGTAMPTASKGLEQLVEPSPSQQEELRRRFPHAFSA